MSRLITASPVLELADPIDPPLTPSAFDDEFNTNTLDASWTRVGSFDDVNAISAFATVNGTGNRWSMNGVQANGRKSWLMLQADLSSGARYRKPITFPSEYVVIVRMSACINNVGQSNNDGDVTLSLLDPSTGTDTLNISVNEADSNIAQIEFAQIVSGVTTNIGLSNNIGGASNAVGQCAHAVAIQRISATYHGWAMSAAGNWLYMGSSNYAGTAPTHAQFSISSAVNSYIGGIDYFRYRAGRFLP